MIPPQVGRPSHMLPASPMEVHKMYKQRINSTVYIPSYMNMVSIATEFMYKWFTNKFEHDFFKSINIDGKNPLCDMKQWNIKDWLKRQKPALSIGKSVDLKFDRDHIDQDYFFLNGYTNRTNNKNTFLSDKDNNVYLGMTTRLGLMSFMFRIKFSTQAEQVDCYDFMDMAFGPGLTQSPVITVDYHIPPLLIARIADALSFARNEDGSIKDSVAFLSYMNKHSTLPVLYKLRGINQRKEFFLRIPGVMLNIREVEMDADQGEREGMLMTNFGIEMQCQVRFPRPKFFVYYSYSETEQTVYENLDTGEIEAVDLILTKIPEVNDSKWPIYLSADFDADDINEILGVSLNDMFKTGDSEDDTNDILEVINACLKDKISPEVFLEIKIFNDLKEQAIYIDWNKMLLASRKPLKDKKSHIVVYADLEFINNKLIELRKYNESRL